MPLPTSKYAAQTFNNVDQFKWERIKDKVKDASGIDMNSANNMGGGSFKGVTINWCYSSETQILVIDLFKREFFDPSEQSIDKQIADWIAIA